MTAEGKYDLIFFTISDLISFLPLSDKWTATIISVLTNFLIISAFADLARYQ